MNRFMECLMLFKIFTLTVIIYLVLSLSLQFGLQSLKILVPLLKIQVIFSPFKFFQHQFFTPILKFKEVKNINKDLGMTQ